MLFDSVEPVQVFLSEIAPRATCLPQPLRRKAPPPEKAMEKRGAWRFRRPSRCLPQIRYLTSGDKSCGHEMSCKYWKKSRNRVVNQHCSLNWSIVLRACHGAMLRTYYGDNSRRSCQQKRICIERERVLNVMFINVLRIHLHLRVWVYIADTYVYITCIYIYYAHI